MGFRRLLVYDNNMRLGEAMRHVWGKQHTRHCRMYRMLMQEAGEDEAKREHAHNAIMLLSEFIHSDVFHLNYVVLGRESYLLGNATCAVRWINATCHAATATLASLRNIRCSRYCNHHITTVCQYLLQRRNELEALILEKC